MSVETKNGMVVIRPYLKESVCSWVMRMCLAHGIEPSHLFKHLGVKPKDCAEGLFTQETRDRIESVLGYSCDNFWLNVKVSENIQKSGLRPDYFQITTAPHRTMHRFCAQCLKYDEHPYFRLDWCFQFVRYCIDHKCLLESKCPICSARQHFPFPVFVRETLAGGYVSSLLECTRCGNLLFEVEPVDLLRDLRSCPLSIIEREKIEYGMSAMASMVFGYGVEVMMETRLDLKIIAKFVMIGLTPNSYTDIDAKKVRERLQRK